MSEFDCTSFADNRATLADMKSRAMSAAYNCAALCNAIGDRDGCAKHAARSFELSRVSVWNCPEADRAFVTHTIVAAADCYGVRS